jgi:SP family sugar:H+ symporter-like MFS transporter
MNRPVSQIVADPAASDLSRHGQRPIKLESALPVSIPHVTLRTVFMAILVAMGGFIFGYDTGQISGFLEMQVFLQRFGQPGPVTKDSPTGYHFTNVRSGLIVALVSLVVDYTIKF